MKTCCANKASQCPNLHECRQKRVPPEQTVDDAETSVNWLNRISTGRQHNEEEHQSIRKFMKQIISAQTQLSPIWWTFNLHQKAEAARAERHWPRSTNESASNVAYGWRHTPQGLISDGLQTSLSISRDARRVSPHSRMYMRTSKFNSSHPTWSTPSTVGRIQVAGKRHHFKSLFS